MSFTETQRAFVLCREPYPAFVGGFGCMRDETPVITPAGQVAIADLAAGGEVLSWSEIDHVFQRAPASGAFPKGKANLLRVITTQGEFVASEHHRVRVPDGTYRQLASFGAGDSLSTFSERHRQTIEGLGRIWLPEDDRHYWRTLADWMDGYAGAGHLCDPRLRRAVESALAFVPSQDDARQFGRRFAREGALRADDQAARTLERIHLGLCGDRQHRTHFLFQLARLAGASADQALAGCVERTSGLIRTVLQSLRLIADHRRASGSPQFGHLPLGFAGAACQSPGRAWGDSFLSPTPEHGSGFCRPDRQSAVQCEARPTGRKFDGEGLDSDAASSGSITKAAIICIERLRRKEWFWDLHVAGNNNYVTADGVIHHNSGKTASAIARAMYLKSLFRQQDIAYYLPSFPLVEDIAMRRFPAYCEAKGWSFKMRGGTSPHIEFPGAGRVLFRSMSTPAAIVGYEVAHSICDELDTLRPDLARDVWNKIIARNRQKLPEGVPNTVAAATTPEGFGFVYERWVKSKAPGYVLFRAKTMDNAANLPPGYIENLRNSYPSNLLAAYLDGEFVNLTAGSVYPEFDRALNAAPLGDGIKPGETLHVGMDFNVAHGAAVIHVLRGDDPIAMAEYADVYDTPAMIRLLKRDFPDNPVMVYPDPTGKNRKSQNASETDLALLRDAKFRVCAPKGSPAVKDRVLSFNAMLHKDGRRRYRVNVQNCPQLVESLEKQAYDKHGEPDKSGGLDHILDAAGYFIVYRYPIVKRIASVREFRL